MSDEDYLNEHNIRYDSPEEANEIIKQQEGYYDPSQLDLETEIEKHEKE